MSEEKNNKRRYTAQEMRDAASTCETVEVADQFYSVEMDHAAAMLRQAADAEEERELEEKVKWSTDKYTKDEYDKIVAERDALKAQVAERDKRIEHIVKDANAMLKVNSLIHDDEANSYTRNQVYTVLTSILDIAKGKES